MAVLTAPTKAIVGINRDNPISRGIHFCYSFDNRLGKDINGKFDLIKYGSTEFRNKGIKFSNSSLSSKDYGAGRIWSVIDQFSAGKPGMTFLNVFSLDAYPEANESAILSHGSYSTGHFEGVSGTMFVYRFGASESYIRVGLWDDTFGMRTTSRGNMPLNLIFGKIYVGIGTIVNGASNSYLWSPGLGITKGGESTYSNLTSTFGARLINVGGAYDSSNPSTIKKPLNGTIYLSAGFLRALSLAEIYSLIQNPYQILKTI